MSFISLYFILFLIVVLFVYFTVPKKYRYLVLLVASYIFYLINDLRAVIFILLTTVTNYFSAVKLKSISLKQKEFFAGKDEEWLKENKKKFTKKFRKKRQWLLALTLLFNFGILFMLKYFTYLADAFAEMINVQPLGLEILLPLGISFYMFQTAGYLIDVYYNKVEPQKNIFKFALFVSFFPQLVQGPISRYNQLAPQLIEGNDFDTKQLKSGVLLMLWGYFKKLVIADRANILFETIMQNYTSYQGLEIFVAMLCFVLKLYCDFSGGIDIATGVAKCFGIDLTPNFKRPFFALSVTEYWRRWHITLGAWMKDYVLYPLTLSKGYNKFIRGCKKVFKKGVAGKVIPSGIAMFFVFLLVGIWHGPDLAYLLFGVYNGVIILIETIFNETRKLKKIKPKERKKSTQRFITFVKFAVTFMLVFFGKYFSAAASLGVGIDVMFDWFLATFRYTDITLLFNNFFSRTDFNLINIIILLVSTAILIFVEVLQERGLKIREFILSKRQYIQWIIFYVAVIVIILMTAYDGTGGGFAYENF